jgi:hypothetical protein
MTTSPRSGTYPATNSTPIQPAAARSGVTTAQISRPTVATQSPSMTDAAVPRTATPQTAPANRQVPSTATKSKIVNGRRYIWVVSPPGSNLGGWVEDYGTSPSVIPPATNAPVLQPARSPSPSPIPRRR